MAVLTYWVAKALGNTVAYMGDALDIEWGTMATDRVDDTPPGQRPLRLERLMKFEVYDDELRDGEVGFITKEGDDGELITGVQFFTGPQSESEFLKLEDSARGTITFWGLHKARDLFEQALSIIEPMLATRGALSKAIDKTSKDE